MLWATLMQAHDYVYKSINLKGTSGFLVGNNFRQQQAKIVQNYFFLGEFHKIFCTKYYCTYYLIISPVMWNVGGVPLFEYFINQDTASCL